MPGEFTARSFVGLTVVASLVLAPLGISNFVRGEAGGGLGILGVLLVLGLNSALIVLRGRYYPTVAMFALVAVFSFAVRNSLGEVGTSGIAWCFPAILALFATLPEKRAWLANALFLGLSVPPLFELTEAAVASRITLCLLLTSAVTGVLVRVIARQQRQLTEMALTDPLTQVYNRGLLDTMLQQAAEHQARTAEPVTIVTLDVDHFKSINDRFGHAVGDSVLVGVASLLKKRLRGTDQIFRIGGEEFLILLRGAGPEEAARVADELRMSIRDSNLLSEGKVTMSLGLATLEEGERIKSWLKRSDTNMYAAKQSGRDQVVA